MSSFVLFDDRWTSLHSRSPRVPASEVAAMHSAIAILQASGEMRSRVAAECEAAAEQARQAGRSAGYEAGWRAAAEQIEQRLVEVERRLAQERSSRSAEVGALALQVVRQVAGEFGSAETTSALIVHALARLVIDEPVTVQLHSSIADSVAARLEDYDIVVIPDDDISEEVAELRVGHSAIDVGLGTQLAAIEAAIAKVNEAAPLAADNSEPPPVGAGAAEEHAA